MKEGIWDKSNGKELYEKTLGIIGCGRIGQRVARMAKHGYEMRVIGHDSKPNYESGIDFVSLDELLEKSDYISMHIPKEKGKPPVISSNELNKMKKTAYLIDVSRGGNVDETALYNALSSKIIAGAARDVHDLEDSKFTEAYKTNPEKFPLLGLENFIPTPHLGASTEEGQKMIGLEMAEVIVGYLKKGDLTNAVNLGVEKEKEAQRYIVSIHYEDMPGVFGKIGTIFGKYNINIDKHPIGPLKEGSKIINYFVESPVDEKIISEIKAIKGIYSVRV
jgi:D-3-phosphoglycerate dehydrogenase